MNPQPEPEWSPTYTLEHHITPEIKARAAAEWAAMDDEGNLPEGWVYEREDAA